MARRCIPLLALLLLLLTPSAAGAQFFEEPFPEEDPFGSESGPLEETLDIWIDMADPRKGTIDLTGLGSLSTDRQFSLARRIGDDLGLARSSYEIPEPGEELAFDDFEELDFFDQRLALDQRLPNREGDTWRLQVDTAPLLRTASLNGFEDVSLTVCPAAVDFEDTSSRPADFDEDGCRTWDQGVRDPSPVTISILEKPDADRYWKLVAILAAVCAGLALFSIGLGWFMRARLFRTLNGFNIAAVLFLTACAIFAAVIGAIVIAVSETAVADLVLAESLTGWEHFLAVCLPALLLALPPLVAAVTLTGARPPVFAAGVSGPLAPAPPFGAPVPAAAPAQPWTAPASQPGAAVPDAPERPEGPERQEPAPETPVAREERPTWDAPG